MENTFFQTTLKIFPLLSKIRAQKANNVLASSRELRGFFLYALVNFRSTTPSKAVVKLALSAMILICSTWVFNCNVSHEFSNVQSHFHALLLEAEPIFLEK